MNRIIYDRVYHIAPIEYGTTKTKSSETKPKKGLGFRELKFQIKNAESKLLLRPP